MTTNDSGGRLLTSYGEGPSYSDYRQAFRPKTNSKGQVIGRRRLLIPNDNLKRLQKNLIDTFLSLKPYVGNSAHAYVRSRGIKTGAEAHVGHKYLVTMDLKDFFGSVRRNMIIRNTKASEAPTDLVQDLCKWGFLFDGLPQGAPSSPVLSNIAARSMDRMLEYLVRTWRRQPTRRESTQAMILSGYRPRIPDYRVDSIQYTRYADDLTFSSDYPKLWQIVKSVTHAVNKCGFTVNPKKTRCRSKPNQLKCVGVVINSQLSTARVDRRALRAELHNVMCEAFNPEFHPNHILVGGEAVPVSWDKLRGRIAHAAHINEDQGRPLKDKFDLAYQAHNTPQEDWDGPLAHRITNHDSNRIHSY